MMVGVNGMVLIEAGHFSGDFIGEMMAVALKHIRMTAQLIEVLNMFLRISTRLCAHSLITQP